MALDRRGFIKFAVGGTTGILLTPTVWKLTDDASIWTQNWSWIPRLPKGEITYAATTSKLCPSNCGLKIAMVGGQPFRAEGDPASPLSQGAVSSMAASEVQLHYSPARVKSPLRMDGGKAQSISWDDAMKLLGDKLAGLKGQPGKVAVICGDETGSLGEVLSGFLAKLGSSDFYMMPGDAQVASKTWTGIMGGQGQVGYDIENADLVLAISADLFDAWGPSVRNAKAFSASHPIGGPAKAMYVYAGSQKNRTAAVCERYLPILPGTEAALALGLAAALIRQGAKADGPDFAEFASFVGANYSAKQTEAATGVPAQDIESLAAALAKAKSPVVITGSDSGLGAGATQFLAGMSLNVLLGRIGKAGGVAVLPEAQTVVSGGLSRSGAYAKDLVQYLSAIEGGKVAAPEVLLVCDANPVFALPQSEVAAKALKKIPLVVSFNPFLDETTALAGLVLPTSMPLERQDDVYTPYGLGKQFYTQNKPVMKPRFDTKATGDVVLALAKRIGADLGFAGYADVLKAKAGKVGQGNAAVPTGLNLGAKVLAAKPTAATSAADYPLLLAPVAKRNVGTAVTGIPPHNVSVIRGTTLKDQTIFVELNGATAKKYGVAEGDAVKVIAPQGEIKALVHVFEGMPSDVLAAPLGFGHTALDEFSRSKGDNVCKLLTVSAEPGTGMSVWTGSRVKIAKI